jgi:hypothetical protein
VQELVPIILGTMFGGLIGWSTRGLTRVFLSIAAVLVSGAIAAVLSGEYVESRVYLLLDLGEAALGLALGFVMAHRLLSGRAAPSGRQTGT